MKKIFYSLLLLLITTVGYSQVSGVIVDENNEPMPGVSVIQVGSQNGTAADIDGQFTIDNVSVGDELEFSFIGYEIKKLKISNIDNLHIKMYPSSINMNEVVVMGYSAKSKNEIASAVTVVDGAKLNDTPSNDVGGLLQGKVAGVQVVSSSGEPGSGSQVRIRGVSTIKPGNAEPLYVVDGIIGGSFDPNDVETLTVLKDAGATGMYGARANKGVIIVTTKSAKSGTPIFEFKSNVGYNFADHGNVDMMNGSEFYDWSSEQYRDPVNHKIDKIKFYQDYPQELRDKNHNWIDEAFKPALFQKYYLSARGISDKLSYYLSGSYYNEKGTFMNTGFQRLNFRTNTTYKFNDRVTVKNNINISSSNGKSFDYMDMYYSYLAVPWDNPFNSDGTPKYVDGKTQNWWSRDHINPFHTVENSDHTFKNFDINYDFVLDIKITDWMSFISSNRITYSSDRTHDFVSPLAAGNYHNKGFVSQNSEMYVGGISTNLLRFNKDIDKHSFSGLVGVEYDKGYSEYMNVKGTGLPEGFDTPAVAASEQDIDGSNSTEVFQSFISQVNYNYDGTYFLTGSYRIDATSNFPSSNRVAHFPSISGSWMVNKMSFLEDVQSLDLFKLRLSYGVTGDPDIGAGRYLGLYNLNTHYNGSPAATPYQLANEDLTWERTNQYNLGIDIGLFDRVNFSIDLYNNVTNDLIVLASQPLSQGFEYRWENQGSVTNRGIEVSLSTVNIKTDSFRWTTDFVFAQNKNTLSGIDHPFYTTINGISQIYRNGAEIYTFILPKWMGVDPATGGPLWEKVEEVNGKEVRSNTSDYSEATLQEVGKALPDFTGGISSTMEYKNFTFYFNVAYQYGNDIYNFTRTFMDNDGHEPYYNNMNPKSDWSRWERPGDNATHPSMQNNSLSKENSSRFLESGSFMKIRTASLRYRLPKKWVSGMHLKELAIGFNVNNVYTFTNYWGQDPEVSLAGGDWSMPGVSDFKYPNNRQFIFNLDIKF